VKKRRGKEKKRMKKGKEREKESRAPQFTFSATPLYGEFRIHNKSETVTLDRSETMGGYNTLGTAVKDKRTK